VNHWRAKRLLACLPDATLPAHTEAAVRTHVARCARCRAVLREHEACEALVRRLPASLLPQAPNALAEHRLAGLARWAARAQTPRVAWSAPAVLARRAALLAAAAGMAIALRGEGPSPLGQADRPGLSAEPFNFVLASAGTDAGALAAVHRPAVPGGAGGGAPLELYLLPVGLR
jgi:anti-sigma factor RsiW